MLTVNPTLEMMELKNVRNVTLLKRFFRNISAHARALKKFPLVTSKVERYNQTTDRVFSKLEEIPLTTKGWANSKSIGDYFIVHRNIQEFDYPMHNFKDLELNNHLVDALREQNITQATSFQYKAIIAALSNHHTLFSAETGCGKTIAYLLPIIHKLIGSKCDGFNKPRALILVPNRELAHQIGDVAKKLIQNVNLRAKVIVGGHTKKVMLNPDFSEVDILVSTPGIIGKLSTVGVYKLNGVEFAVFDECDSLIDDSFLDRIETLLKRVSQAQIMLVSATLPKKLPAIFDAYEQDMICIKSPRLHKPLVNVNQKFMRLNKSSKPSHLLQIAKKSNEPLLIFSNRNETCNWVAMFLRENGLKCANINGDMNSNIRINQWNEFSKGLVNILSATDIASRGLNTLNVNHVLNYDFPLYAADYIHRIGRVGRLGSLESAKITNFISSIREINLVQQVELAIRTNTAIANVEGNITSLVKKHIFEKRQESS